MDSVGGPHLVKRPGATRCNRCRVITPNDELRPVRFVKGTIIRYVCRDCRLRLRRLKLIADVEGDASG